ncbi:MAG: hypothetical protein HRF49_04590 [bacterium]
MFRHYFYTILVGILALSSCSAGSAPAPQTPSAPPAAAVSPDSMRHGADGETMALLLAEFDRIRAQAEANPSPPPDVPVHFFLDEYASVVRILYPNVGDYNLDGEVGISDLSVLAARFGASKTDGDNDLLDMWLDSDGSGDVGVGDVTLVALRFMSKLEGFKVWNTQSNWSRLLPPPPAPEDQQSLGYFEFNPGMLDDGFSIYQILPSLNDVYWAIEAVYSGPRRPEVIMPEDRIIRWDGYEIITEPETNQRIAVESGKVNVILSFPYKLGSPLFQTFLSEKGARALSADMEDRSFKVLLPPDISILQAVADWPNEKPDMFYEVSPIRVFGGGDIELDG